MLRIEDQIRLIPDPLKAIVRLGRADLTCKEHLECYWKSFCDNHQFLKYNEIQYKLAIAMTDRYKSKLKCVPTFDMMH